MPPPTFGSNFAKRHGLLKEIDIVLTEYIIVIYYIPHFQNYTIL